MNFALPLLILQKSLKYSPTRPVDNHVKVLLLHQIHSDDTQFHDVMMARMLDSGEYLWQFQLLINKKGLCA